VIFGVGMFKESSSMDTFIVPPPPLSSYICPINMISCFTSGSLQYFDSLVVPCPEEFDCYGDIMALTLVDISSPTISLASTNIVQNLHLHMEYDFPTLTT